MRELLAPAAMFGALLMAACAAPEAPGRGAGALPPPPAAGVEAVAGAAPAPAAAEAPAEARDPGMAADVTVEVPKGPLPELADPRSPAQRMADIKAWDECVMRAQRIEEDPFGRANPVSATPEEMCRTRLGMSSRTSAPDRR